MSFFDYVDKLRAKSPPERHFIALLVSAACTIVIFLVWLSVFRLEFKNAGPNTDGMREIATPFQAISSTVTQTYDDVRNQFNTFISKQAKSGLTGVGK